MLLYRQNCRNRGSLRAGAPPRFSYKQRSAPLYLLAFSLVGIGWCFNTGTRLLLSFLYTAWWWKLTKCSFTFHGSCCSLCGRCGNWDLLSLESAHSDRSARNFTHNKIVTNKTPDTYNKNSRRTNLCDMIFSLDSNLYYLATQIIGRPIDLSLSLTLNWSCSL